MANIALAAGADRTGDGFSSRPGQEEAGVAAPDGNLGFRTTTVCLERWPHVVFGWQSDTCHVFSVWARGSRGSAALLSPALPVPPTAPLLLYVVSPSQWVEMHKDSGHG